MSDYSDIIFLMASMIIFSMLTSNTARTFQSSSDALIRADLEYRAIAVAQDEIDQIRWESDENKLDPDHGSYLFDDYPETRTINYGESEEYSEVFIITASSEFISEYDPDFNRYIVSVTATSNALEPEISATLSYIKTYLE